MAQDDPFAAFDSDKTIILPRPGQRPSRPTPEAPRQWEEPVPETTASSGLNPLVAAANPLLNLVPQLRATPSHPNPDGLREHLVNQMRVFESRAKTLGYSQEKVLAARYVLCTFLDETAASTPWGGSGQWARNSLLVTFHNEAWGGEKFFLLLNKLAETPDQNRDLLELMYVCISLGFEGRYRVMEGGRAQLDALRERLLVMLRQQSGEPDRALSPRWQGVTIQGHPVLRLMPLWVLGAVLGVLLLGLYLIYSYNLGQASDPVFSDTLALRAKHMTPRMVAPAKPRLAILLKDEITAGLLEVRDESDRSVVILRGSNMFDAGSATLSDQYQDLIPRIGRALDGLNGAVVVTGHTDNVPSRSLQFPSNWHLSRARADTVQTLLGGNLRDRSRLSAEGHADSEPVALNDTPENRARNRRVEITLFTAEAAPTVR